MDDGTRRWLRWGIGSLVIVLSILFFFQTRDPMLLIFGIIATTMVAVSLRPPSGVLIRVKCTACGALNEEHAKFCSQCGRAI